MRETSRAPAAQGNPSSPESHPAGNTREAALPNTNCQLSLSRECYTFLPCRTRACSSLTHPQGAAADTDCTGKSLIHTLDHLRKKPSYKLCLTDGQPCLAKPSTWKAPVPGPHKHDFSTEIKPVTAKGQTQALQILSTTQPHTLAP